ncbi:MAG TPA: hypothetical protein VJU82_12040 [Acidobacteriaceae bacterium]|nr:hypothetical protein [Acidobacteriaceae bacterium]
MVLDTLAVQASDSKSGLRGLIVGGVILYLLFSGLVFFQIRHRDDGHVVYALDDPYISLALSEQIAHGTYAINTGEPSSPCSSIVWPFLLAPFTGSPLHEYAPLILNLVFGGSAVVLVACALREWVPEPLKLWSAAWWLALIMAGLLMFVGNLVSLTFLGMEHVLQVLVSIACAIALCRVWDGKPVPRWGLLAGVVAPMVRYEDIALTVALSVGLALTGARKAAAGLFAVALVPLVLFGMFLHHLGLPALPMSVLMKGSVRPQSSWPAEVVHAVLRSNYHALLRFGDPLLWPMLALAFVLAVLGWRERDRLRRAVLLAGLLVALLQLAVGRFGWFHRYEDYAVIFATLIVVRACVSGMREPVLLSLVLLGMPYLLATEQTPAASQEAYRLNYQMHRFVAGFYRGNVMVNDLGLVSFRRSPGTYVLDLDGLGSLESAKVQDRTAAWLEQIGTRHHIQLAIVFPVPLQIPADWTPLAKLCDPDQRVIMAGCVVFYSTSPEYTASIRSELVRFAGTVPKEDTLRLDPARDDIDVDLLSHRPH